MRKRQIKKAIEDGTILMADAKSRQRADLDSDAA